MISKFFMLTGIVCLGVFGFFNIEARIYQATLERELYAPPVSLDGPAPARKHVRNLKEGELFGRLEVPRLDMSVMVMEGDSSSTLRLGAGHVPGTTLAIAGHRDTFFRPLKDIQVHDTIRLTTPENVTEYRVTSTKIVGPTDTTVYNSMTDDTLMLITCYPFYFVGPAPQRFVVEAKRE